MPLTVLPSLEKSWEMFRKIALPDDASQKEVAEARFVFLSGAAVMFHVVTGALSPGDGITQDDLEIMEAVNDELYRFESGFDAEILRRHSLRL